MTLAHTMHTGRTRTIDRIAAMDILGRVYTPRENESHEDYNERLEKAFNRIEQHSGLLNVDKGMYAFRHLTFQEFLTAAALANRVRGGFYWGSRKVLERRLVLGGGSALCGSPELQKQQRYGP